MRIWHDLTKAKRNLGFDKFAWDFCSITSASNRNACWTRPGDEELPESEICRWCLSSSSCNVPNVRPGQRKSIKKTQNFRTGIQNPKPSEPASGIPVTISQWCSPCPIPKLSVLVLVNPANPESSILNNFQAFALQRVRWRDSYISDLPTDIFGGFLK